MKLSTEAPITLFDLVMQKLNLGSKSKAKKIVEYATIHINDKPNNNPRQIVNPGDIVTLEREKQPAMRVAPPYPILYEDNDLLVALKPAGLLTHAPERPTTAVRAMANGIRKPVNKIPTMDGGRVLPVPLKAPAVVISNIIKS